MIKKNLLLTLSVIISLVSGAQTIDTAKFYVITNKVLGEKQAITGVVNTSLGNTVTLRTASGHPMQQWIMKQEQNGYRIYCREYGSDYSLEVVKEGGKKINLGRTVSNASHQIWRINKNADGTYRLVSLWQNKAIDYTQSTTAPSQLTLTDIESGIKSQTWVLVGKPRPMPVVQPKVNQSANPSPVTVTQPQTPEGAGADNKLPILDTEPLYEIITNEVPDKSLGVGTIDGRIEQAMLVPANTNPFNEWRVSFVGNGLYQLTNKKYDSKSLEVRKDGVENEMVMMAITRNVTEQFWKIVRAPDGNFQITSAAQDGSKSFDFVEDDEVRNEIRMRGFNSTLWSFISLSPKPASTQPVAEATPTPTNKTKLMPREQLKVNEKIFSSNSEFSLVQQGDGNLVIYNAQSKAIWSSGLAGQMARRTIMQEDGNFTQHPDGYNSVLWSTETKGNAGAYALLQDDGVLVVVNASNQIIWRSLSPTHEATTETVTSTSAPGQVAEVNNRLVADQELRPTNFIISQNGKYKLIQQEDGNLVIYEGDRPTWSTGTNGRKIQRCVMQKDGNLVLYDIFKDAIWASNTHGNENAYVVLNDEGVLEMFNSNNQVIWRSKN